MLFLFFIFLQTSNKVFNHLKQCNFSTMNSSPVSPTFSKVLCAAVFPKTEAFQHFIKIQLVSQICVDVHENQVVEAFFGHR